MPILNAFNDGGPFMFVILAFGIFSIAFILERGLFLYFNVKNTSHNFREKINEYLEQADLQSAIKHAKQSGGNTGKIVAMGLLEKLSGGSEEHIQARMDEQLSREIAIIDRRTGFLAMFGNVATLVGLLGTITGMIHSFAAVATASPMDRATMLSKGISEAMNCTAFGLIVAVPALIAFAIYQNKTDRLITEMTNTCTEIFHDLIFLFDNSAKQSVTNQSNTPQYRSNTNQAANTHINIKPNSNPPNQSGLTVQ